MNWFILCGHANEREFKPTLTNNHSLVGILRHHLQRSKVIPAQHLELKKYPLKDISYFLILTSNVKEKEQKVLESESDNELVKLHEEQFWNCFQEGRGSPLKRNKQTWLLFFFMTSFFRDRN